MSASRSNTRLFAQHSRSWQHNRYVYPVISRRSRGLSIGVNLNPDRICNFDCVYCCVDRTAGVDKPEAVDLAILRSELDAMLALVVSGEFWRTPPFDKTPPALRRFNDIAFSGDGEPTACRVFDQACRLAGELLANHHLAAKLVVITNATLLDRPSVQATLQYLDTHHGEIWAKLDAGNENVYRQIIRSSIPYQKILDNLRDVAQRRDIVIQSMFLSFNGQPPAEADIADYVDQLRQLKATGARIALVQAYTIARPVFESHVAPVQDAVLDDIVARIQQAGLAAEAYYAVSHTDH